MFQFINVPMGVWIDEQGRVVRPAEPAWTSSRTDTFGGKPLAIEGELYVAALRDWVTNGDKSQYVLSDEEFARRVKARSPAEMEADASFKLAVWFQQAGKVELAAKYFERAQTLNPDDWNYHRQEWSFTPQEAGKNAQLERPLRANRGTTQYRHQSERACLVVAQSSLRAAQCRLSNRVLE